VGKKVGNAASRVVAASTLPHLVFARGKNTDPPRISVERKAFALRISTKYNLSVYVPNVPRFVRVVMFCIVCARFSIRNTLVGRRCRTTLI
jgi:hypothetical protein